MKALNMINRINHTGDIMEIEISKVGERGQVVIPQDFRNELKIKSGEKFIVVKIDDKLIFLQMSKLKSGTIEQLKEDLVDMKLAEDRMKELEEEKKISQTKEEFFKEMKKWVME